MRTRSWRLEMPEASTGHMCRPTPPPLRRLRRTTARSVIDRPAQSASPTALGDHAFVHGYEVIRDTIAGEGASLDLLVLLFANAATITAATIDDAIAVMNAQPDLDSAVTVSWSQHVEPGACAAD